MITAGRGGVYLDLHVQPGARRPGVRGIQGGRLKIAVAAPAEDDRANKAVLSTIADLMGVSHGAVSLVAGSTSRRKRVHVLGVDQDVARKIIGDATSG